MAHIHLDQLGHRYGSDSSENYAVKPLDLAWNDGGAYALLGPSGCGKTTLLNIISGLLHPSEGRVLFDQQDVTDLSPEQRNIAQVFQFPVVYDTMTVAENLAFPLRNRKLPVTEIEQRVLTVLQMLGMQDKAHHRARSLNADDKQKISLGRGLVRTDVNAILFDEPLTVIDPQLKWELRTELKKIHQQFGHTMIYVTHDQTEALTFADQVVVMYEGEVVQIGTPQELFDKPRHVFVGKFIGSPGMNVLDAEPAGSAVIIDGHHIALQKQLDGKAPLQVGIRPEHIRLSPDGDIPLQIFRIEDLGRHLVVHGYLGDQQLSVVVPEGAAVPDNPGIELDAERINLYRDDILLEPVST